MRVVVCQYIGIDATPALPLAAGCLVATARAEPSLREAFSFDIEVERLPIADAVEALAADIVAFSLYPWNLTYSLAVAQALRAARPAVRIYAGGPSVPRDPDRARRFLDTNPALDILAFAEGEATFCALLHTERTGTSPDSIGGIAYRGPDGPTVTTAPTRMLAFDAHASPFLDGTFDTLWERHPGRFSLALCETNRGCPFSCTYCDWSLTKRVVEFPLERVEAELRWAVDRGITHIMLADANFGIRPRDLHIVRYIAELRRTTGLPHSFYWYLTKNNHQRNLETIEILHEAGIATWVGLAVQDFDEAVLAAVKRDKIQTGEAAALRRICADRDIPTFNELILGLPGQTFASFAATLAEGMPPFPRHDFVLFLCRLIENAELGSEASRAEHGLETRRSLWVSNVPGVDAIVDEYHELVVGTATLPPSEWRRAFRLGYFAAATYNLRVLRIVYAFVGAHRPLAAFLEHLAARFDRAPVGSVYAEIGATLDRYADSILASGPLILPLAGDDGLRVTADEAAARIALHRYDAFLAETRAEALAFFAAEVPEPLDAAFRYQRFVHPTPGQAEPQTRVFDADWPAWFAAHGRERLAMRTTRVTFHPPTYAAFTDEDAFATSHLAMARARMALGRVETDRPIPVAGAAISA